MAIAKKTLYIISGVLKVVVGGFAIVISLLLVLLQSLMRSTLEADPKILEEMIKGIAEVEEYAYLNDYTQSEQIDYVLGVLSKFALVVGIIAITWVVLAIFLFILAKKISREDFRKKESIILTVISWVVSMFTISTILTTIATCLRKRKNKEKHEEIEAYQE